MKSTLCVIVMLIASPACGDPAADLFAEGRRREATVGPGAGLSDFRSYLAQYPDGAQHAEAEAEVQRILASSVAAYTASATQNGASPKVVDTIVGLMREAGPEAVIGMAFEREVSPELLAAEFAEISLDAAQEELRKRVATRFGEVHELWAATNTPRPTIVFAYRLIVDPTTSYRSDDLVVPGIGLEYRVLAAPLSGPRVELGAGSVMLPDQLQVEVYARQGEEMPKLSRTGAFDRMRIRLFDDLAPQVARLLGRLPRA